MDTRRALLTAGAAAAALCGCASVEAVAQRLIPSNAEVVSLYGIAKGIAGIAVLADPALIPVLDAITAVADPLVARLQTQDDDAAATQLTGHAHTLILAAAPAIRAVPAPAAT